MSEAGFWRRCSACRGPIGLGAKYYACSVSTCNRARTATAFCSVNCWQAHSVSVRHRDAWAEENVAPTRPQEDASPAPAARNVVRRVVESKATKAAATVPQPGPNEALIVVSRLKEFIRGRSLMNTSDGVVDLLSNHVRKLSLMAIQQASAEGRKTVLDRDFEKALREYRGIGG